MYDQGQMVPVGRQMHKPPRANTGSRASSRLTPTVSGRGQRQRKAQLVARGVGGPQGAVELQYLGAAHQQHVKQHLAGGVSQAAGVRSKVWIRWVGEKSEPK
jgi:hypothetical protein